MLLLDDIINFLIENSLTNIKNKLHRNTFVIQTLKKFNIEPKQPPNDFDGVYAYTLIEYGVGKQKSILELFKRKEVRNAFCKAFNEKNFSILINEGEEFLNWHILGNQLRSQGINPRKEFAEFSAVFINLVKSTRTPTEVRQEYKIDSQFNDLQQKIDNIQQRLAHLNLDELRITVNQLVQSFQRLLPTVPSIGNRDGLNSLTKQMKAWFEALRYDFEPTEVWGESYFEWIINVPSWRGSDRILVRGIEGEAEVSDVTALRHAVNENRTDGGWLVAARRKSPAARNFANQPENRDLVCYTFDELLDEAADFSGYFSWLENEVTLRQIDKMYVPLACTKEEFDPVTKKWMAKSHYGEQDGWIDGYIDRWLDDPDKKHLSILGEFGTGKTWFALHYAWTALQRYKEAKQRGVERPRLPLVIPLRDYAKAVSVESLFSEFFFRKHEIRQLNYSAFKHLNQMGKLLLIFDGFDEMAAKIDRQKMINNFWELARVVVPGAKAILTCRTEHFPEAKEGRALLNAELKASVANLTGEPPNFEVLELAKFNDNQIRRVLSSRAEPATVERVMGDPQLLDLARRPIMGELILEALPEIEAGKPVDLARVYLYATKRKMVWDIKAERTFTSLASKLYFLCELSWQMLSTDQIVNTGQCLRSLEAHGDRVWSIAFSPDGQMLASGSGDRTIKLWDVSTGRCLDTLIGHGNWVRSVAFSPNGRMLASGSEDETIKLWNVKTGEWQKTLRKPRPYESMNITAVKGLTESQKASLKALGAFEGYA